MSTIRGTRYAVELFKTVAGSPMWSTQDREVKVCDVVFRFPHGDGETYVQFEDNPPILDKPDVEQILTIINSDFDESKFKFTPTN